MYVMWRTHCAPFPAKPRDGEIANRAPPPHEWTKMAQDGTVPSDLYQHVYSFLVENKFAKAAKEFLKQAKVVRALFRVYYNPSLARE